MQDLILREAACGNCGYLSKQTFCPAATTLGNDSAQPPDLDTRPHGAIRETVPYWIQQCQHCGYCSGDLASIHETSPPVIETPEYQRFLTDSRLPEPSRRFLAHARLLAHAGQLADAGWTCLHGAWICDDAHAHEAAALARGYALSYWRDAKKSGEEFCEPGLDVALVTDLLRRMGRFEDALIQCSQALDTDDEDEPLPALVEHILRFEKTLIQKRDTGTYRLNDLPAFSVRT